MRKPECTNTAFHAAIDRLVEGKPHNPQLRAKAAKGRLKINFSSVALEAGRSRTLIAVPTDEELLTSDQASWPKTRCAYPDVRKRVQDLMNTPARRATQSSTIASLRAEKSKLEVNLRDALCEARAHLTARQKAERDAERWRQEYRKLFARVEAGENVVSIVD